MGLGGTEKTRRALTRNIMSPVSATSAVFQNIYGDSQKQLESYAAFEANYRRAIAQELKSSVGLSPARRQALEAAARPTGSISLGLISSLQERQRLNDEYLYGVLKFDAAIEGLGMPGLYIPSSNPFRATARMLATTEQGYSPVIDLFQQSTVSIDPYAEERSICRSDVKFKSWNNKSTISSRTAR